jgi:hypothetical protein
MGISKLTDAEVINWLSRQVVLRRELSDLCSVAGAEVAYDSGVSENILVYDTGDFKRLAKICNASIDVLRLEDSATDLTTEFRFYYGGIKINTYVSDKEVNNE